MSPVRLKKEIPPRIVAWEVTRACNLACRHCRATAVHAPHADELNTGEAKAFLRDLAQAGSPMLILTGGEPLLRPDIFELANYARELGLRAVMAVNGTLVTPQLAAKLRDSGIARCSVSLDGADHESHDALRGVSGAFAKALRGIEHLKAAGLPFQINTTVSGENLARFEEIFHLAVRLGAAAWHVFFLVPVGRGAEMTAATLGPAEYEAALHRLYDLEKTSPIQVKATCAPQYNRIKYEREAGDYLPGETRPAGTTMTRGCLAATGFCFVGHTGTVQPCGYLELDCGNVRHAPFAEIWQGSTRLQSLREQEQYAGKCGPCRFHSLCGGCRARSLAAQGDPLGADPLCLHEPKTCPPTRLSSGTTDEKHHVPQFFSPR